MISKHVSEVLVDFMHRHEKLCTGELIPGHNACKPPYDSEWEREFEWALSKNLGDFMILRNQVPFGPYRADFTFECVKTGRVWIIEFDDKTFHDPVYDRKRDAAIFRHHPQVQMIVRVDAKTGHHEIDETRAMLTNILPECFTRVQHLRHEWHEDGNAFVARVFDSWIHSNEDSWWDDERECHKPGAPMLDMRIEVKRRAA